MMECRFSIWMLFCKPFSAESDSKPTPDFHQVNEPNYLQQQNPKWLRGQEEYFSPEQWDVICLVFTRTFELTEISPAIEGNECLPLFSILWISTILSSLSYCNTSTGITTTKQMHNNNDDDDNDSVISTVLPIRQTENHIKCLRPHYKVAIHRHTLWSPNQNVATDVSNFGVYRDVWLRLKQFQLVTNVTAVSHTAEVIGCVVSD